MLHTSYLRLIWPPLAALTAWQFLISIQMLLLLGHNDGMAYAQSDNAIGAHRVFEKTSFSCAGRPAGYYADIETGCQVYHMCDGLGRQFSYSCPNTTLFQQRMLICDHWYMVNCSKAESHYAANLLIGQRDKPFVDDEESNLRTPRPDLLDRPYAPDYSGESFRNQYKQFSASQNQIQDTDSKQRKQEKVALPQQNVPAPQHWKLPAPSRTIEPPAFEAQGTESTTPLSVIQQRYPSTTATLRSHSRQQSTSSYRPTPNPVTVTSTTASPTFTPLKRQQPSGATFNSAPLLQRQQETLSAPHIERDDLGTSHSTRYNTSSDFNSAEVVTSEKKVQSNLNFNGRKTQPTKSSVGANVNTLASGVGVKTPSKVYEPPFVYPIYNQNDTVPAPSSTTVAPVRTSSATPFTASTPLRNGNSNAAIITTTTSTTRQPLSRPTTLAGKPFTAAVANTYTTPTTTASSIAYNAAGRNQNNIRYDIQKPSKDVRFQPPTPRPPVNSVKTLKPPTTTQRIEASPLEYQVPTKNRYNPPTPFSSAVNGNSQPASRREDSNAQVPSKDLLPPYPEFVQHDDATTQGPPIYYEWKVPSNGLEPPKLDPPYGVDGREYPDSAIDFNQLSASGAGSGDFTPILSFSIDQPSKSTTPATTATSGSKSTNPFLATARKQKQRHDGNVSATRTPTSRSVKDTAVPNEVVRKPSNTRKGNTSGSAADTALSTPTTEADIEHLREELSVPDFAFPLETIGRTGYLASDTYNSFQLKIPERRSTDDPESENEHLHWFGENPQCPECHPSYVVPGTCEPCLKR